jgi:hypothetical protein
MHNKHSSIRVRVQNKSGMIIQEDDNNLDLQFKSDESIANEVKTMQVMLDRVRSITTKSTA